ncbi:outer membrane receptor protein involved in Fe transport [Salinibacter ruber]|uniref:TonB-dependent receptor n=1 Tax=Salinibacter ruber TaxID=146919 RepID=UPI001622F85B|nr:TonB-dependent receptor [Salinibacter ruber]MBB4068887.1 outer membrane receptor protein involved in Fe transport [Salinibacter ruber]
MASSRHLVVFISLILSILLCTTGAAGAHAYSDSTATVTGCVTQAATGAPLPGANVVLRDPETGARRYGTGADSTGAFALPDVDPARYRLVVTFVGYARHTDRIRVRAGTTMRDTVALKARPLSKQAVTVTARRAQARLDPVTVSTLAETEVNRRLGVQNVPALLSEMPSTTSHSQNGNGIGYSSLRIRGFGQRRLAVALNGVPQNDPEDYDVYWVNLYGTEPAIEDVQVQRGAGASTYGSVGIGGAINIVTDPFEPDPFVRARVGAGSFETRRLSVTANSGLLGDRYVVNARFSRVTSDGYRRNAWTTFNRFFGGIARYGDRSTLTIQAFGGLQKDGLAFSGIPKSANDDAAARRQNPSATSDDRERFHPPQVHLNHEWRFAPAWTLDQTAFWIKGEGHFDYGAPYRSAAFLRLPDGVAIGDGELTDAERQRPLFTFGLSPDDVVLRSALDQHQVGWIPTVVYEDGTTETTVGLEARLHRSLRWGRIQEAAPPIPDAVVGADANHRLWQYRSEKIITSAFASHLFRPERFGGRLAIQADLQLTGRQYRFYDEKTFGREDMQAHAFTTPYFFVNPRLGATLERPRYRLSVNGFWMEFWDEIVPSGGVDPFGVPRTGNADRSRHAGLEVEGTARLLPEWTLSGNAMLARTRFVDFTEYRALGDTTVALERDGNPIASSPEQLANLRTSYSWKGLTASLNLHAVGRQYVNNAGGTAASRREDGTVTYEEDDALSVDPYALFGASLTYEPPSTSSFRGLRLQVTADNLFDTHVLQHGFLGTGGPRFYPAATRHFFVELRYTLR